MLTKVVPVSEIVGRLRGEDLVDVLMLDLQPRLKGLAPVVVETIKEGAWDSAAEQAREMISATLVAEAQSSLRDVADLVVPSLSDVDITPLVVTSLSGENADRLADLVQTVAAQELRTVIRYGALVGLFIGVLEAGLFLTFERWWLLPVIGAVDGVVNNYMGIQMIFRPLVPTKYLRLFTYQGLVPARQHDIAGDYARMIGREVLSIPALTDHLATHHSNLADLARDALIDRLSGPVSMMAMMFGESADEALVHRVTDALMAELGVDLDRPARSARGVPVR